MLMPMGGRVLRLGQDEPAPGTDSTNPQADAAMLLDPGTDPGVSHGGPMPAETGVSLQGAPPQPSGPPQGMDSDQMMQAGGMMPPPQSPGAPQMGGGPPPSGPGMDSDSPNQGLLGAMGGGGMGRLSAQDGEALRNMVKKSIALRGHR